MLRFLSLLLSGCALAASGLAQDLDLRLTEVASGLQTPVFATHAGDGSGRLFIVQQSGRIQVLRDGQLLAEPFLNLEGSVSSDSEQGLLGLAFAPDYASSGRFYVYYTNTAGGSELTRYRVSSNPDRADPASRQVLFAFSQPFPNHNGGWIGFGPDGFLYLASGDGGSGGDPQNHAQRLDTVLGKMLRFDVSGAGIAAAPNNPFSNTAGARPEIWAYGLRNPWRASFDRQTGDLWIGDVGQGRFEEINLQPGTGSGGQNYGWRRLEGSQCYSAGCSASGTVLPVDEYEHSLGCSVTGGYVYRGSRYPRLQGVYLHGDFCSGRIVGLRRIGSGASAADFSSTLLLNSGLPIASFAEDEQGDLYLVGYHGVLYLISDGAPSSDVPIDARFTGTWYDPAQNGHGLFVEVLPNNLLVAYWFTFDQNGQQAWFGGVGPISGNSATVAVVRTTGGRFIPNFDPNAVSFPPLGTLTLRFSSCRAGRVDFELGQGFGSGSMVLQRLTETAGNECPAVIRASAE